MTTTDPSVVLRVAGATRRYGGLTAVDDVSLELGPGERLGVIGPNGAGKTTLFKLIAGEVALTRGSVRFADRDVTRASVRRRARLGVARTFQVSSLFGQLSVEENVRLAEQARFGRRWKAWPERRGAGRGAVDRVLDEMLLADRRRDPVVELSHGERRQLEIAMALVTGPRLLLLDEPAAGLSLRERDRLREVVEALPRTIPLLLIEHDLSLVFGLADRVICLDHGKLIAAGPPAEVRENARVREVYLGQSTTA